MIYSLFHRLRGTTRPSLNIIRDTQHNPPTSHQQSLNNLAAGFASISTKSIPATQSQTIQRIQNTVTMYMS